MPSIFAMFKDYVIESENDVSQEYREEIEKRLSSREHIEKIETPEIIPGKRDTVVTEESKIKDVFQSKQNFYFGHGTPGGEEVINSILENGLEVKDPEKDRGYMCTLSGLDSTTILLGEGTDSLFSEQKNLLDNWPHKCSKDIVIISIPSKYVLRPIEVGTSSDLYEPFYIGSKEKGYTLRPEFIKGIYNADSHTFTPNSNFYQNLEPEQQKNLFDTIRQQYIKLYAEHSKVSPKAVVKPLPLNETELEEVTIEWYKVQLERLRKDKTFQPNMLNANLHEIAGKTLMSDFSDTTHSIRETVQQEFELGEDIDDLKEGEDLDDW